jgi:hypothetical protein
MANVKILKNKVVADKHLPGYNLTIKNNILTTYFAIVNMVDLL